MKINSASLQSSEPLPTQISAAPPAPAARAETRDDRFEASARKRRAFPLPNQFQVEAALGLGTGAGLGWAAVAVGATGGLAAVTGGVFLGFLSLGVTFSILEQLAVCPKLR